MAHSNQARKRIRQNAKRNLRNRSRKSEIKTLTKRIDKLIEEKNLDAATREARLVQKKLDKAAKSNILHQNTADRQKSALARKVNALRTAGGGAATAATATATATATTASGEQKS